VSSPYQRSSLALAEARAVIDRLDPAADADDNAATLIEGWQATEAVLRALLGGSPLSGQPLVGSLRQRNMLSLDQAHALLEFLSARDRAADTGYRPTDGDIAAARAGIATLEAGFPDTRPDVPQLADTAVFQAMHRPSPAGAPGAAAPPPPPPPAAAPVSRRDRLPRIFLAILGLVLVGAIAAAVVMLRGGFGSVESAMSGGIEAYGAGRLERAREEFADAARAHPDAALPHVWLGRIARDQRDDATAAREFSAAERLEPNSAVVNREIGSFHLARGRWDAARARYVRAVQLDTDDRVAMGWLGCSLARLGRVQEAQTWLQRAGQGDWMRCAAQATPPPGAMAPAQGYPAAVPPAPR
jgi:Flp pilus assembly protein TadD